MTSSLQRSPHPPRSRGGPDGPVRLPAYEDSHLDGLFTYCLSVMCEHDAATAALAEALVLAERQHERGRRPGDPELHRPWLYALARWACLRRLTAQRERRPGPVIPRAGGPDAEHRRRELAALAWPEAAGTSPEQRESLELAVRHQLAVAEVAEVLRLSTQAARALLTSGACEVERTRAALAVVEAGGCRGIVALAGSGRDRLVLSTGLRRDLVRHVDACGGCRRAAQRAMASARWPGTSAGTSRLAVLCAPRQAVHAARLAVLRARAQHLPRFDRAGFPQEDRERAARRERLRSRAVTTTVVATVLAAPVLALWAAYRGAPVTGEASGGSSVAAEHEGDAGSGQGPGERDGTGAGPDHSPGSAGGPDGRADDAGPSAGHGDRLGRSPEPSGGRGAEQEGAPGDGPPETTAPHPEDSGLPGPGRLTVEAVSTDDGTQITLTASGGSPVHWTAATDASWLWLSGTSGTLRPGETATVTVTVDQDRQPPGAWRGRITLGPGDAVITVEGTGPEEPAPDPDPPPSDPPPEDPEPRPTGTASGPDHGPGYRFGGPGTGPVPGIGPEVWSS
ncbi:sigma-70 family RNA polymerase sigma factor [Streptomyces sp. ACA25]|uniref:BACON domain-containing protein n=1 Tax=Streptomyces sp. ACA25 TaxID=3022596 RepID=UPI0023073B46|nr:sigma-70 family RNA polymerase sigma factor [Streptomyces sp. ACA25]MDB1086680.1 sigma-70 family RNA polymerase sigma factor [Streptomyces sp. ACA25]